MYLSPSKSSATIIVGLYLSKFDKAGLRLLGFTTFVEAFNAFGYALGAQPATIKNYRDEFDPYFDNPRRGWHGRSMKGYCIPIYETYKNSSLDEFLITLQSILYNEVDFEKSQTNKDQTNTFAKRLITGRSAEEYFRVNYQLVPQFAGYDILDTTSMGTGYDFEVSYQQRNRFYVEVKGLSQSSGAITLTQKE